MNSNRLIFENNTNHKRLVNPNKGLELSPEIQDLIQKYQQVISASETKAEIATIHVDEIASKVALFYEKIRKIIDWKEEQLIRRGAIERILKRRLLSELSGISLISNIKTEEIAEPLVLELVRGGHFANDKIPRKKLKDVQRILEKYIYILENSPLSSHSPGKIKDKVYFYGWIIEIAACEIEEILDPPLKENLLINFMTQMMEDRIQIAPGVNISEEEKRVQIYIAVHRALFHLDSPIISYRLLKLHYPQWLNPTQTFLEEAAKKILLIKEQIEKSLSHPLSSEFYKICEKYDTIYLIIGDILAMLAKNPSEMAKKFSRPEKLEELIKSAYDKRLSTLKSRLFRAAIYSTLSIFVSGGLSLFIVEIPLAKIFYGKFSPLGIAIDILIPTLIMFLLVAIVKLPQESNFKKVITEVKKIAYQQKEKDIYEIRPPKRRGVLAKFLIGLLYTTTSAISLSLTFWIFYIVRIPTTSLILDTMNVAMIVFAGLIIRQRAKEMTIEEKTSFWEFLLDVLSVPVAKVGQWLAQKWREYNVVSVFLTASVDMPLSTFVEFIESWSLFLKEKKAEIH